LRALLIKLKKPGIERKKNITNFPTIGTVSDILDKKRRIDE